MTKTISWDPLQWASLQEKYGQKPGETKTEYLWYISLTRGDCHMLDQIEVDGFWGPGVFLNKGLDPNTESYFITRWTACWTGDTDLGKGES